MNVAPETPRSIPASGRACPQDPRPCDQVPRWGSPRPLRAAFFDAGLTLILTATRAEDVAKCVLRRAGHSAAPDEVDAAMRDAHAALESRWHAQDWWSTEADVRRLFTNSYEAGLLAHVTDDRRTAQALADEIYDEYQDTRHWTLFPDVLPALARLRAAGIRLGVVSDWGHGLEAILLELELGSYFEFLVVSSRLGVSKPNPQVFRMALQRVGVAPDEAVYIGDTYLKDVLGARAAGISPVLLDRDRRWPKVDCARVDDLYGLLDLVGLPMTALPREQS